MATKETKDGGNCTFLNKVENGYKRDKGWGKLYFRDRK